MGSENQNTSSLRPFFDGSDYTNWKFKMEVYLDCDSIKIQDIILKGQKPPKITKDGTVTTLSRDEQRNDQKEENYKNKKAIITIASSMTREESSKLQCCTSAKEMCETLENHYEGNVKVRSKKVQFQMYEYKLFKMKAHKSITEMTNRLMALLTTLKKLGKYFSKE